MSRQSGVCAVPHSVARARLLALFRDNAVGLCTILLLLAFATINPRVMAVDNLRNVLVQACYLVIFASAQMLVIVTRGFDLSLGATVSLVSVVASMAMTVPGVSSPILVLLGLLVALVLGCVIGLVNGMAITLLHVNPFVVTLAMWYIILSLASSVSGGFPISGLPAQLGGWFAGRELLGVPVQVVMTVVLVVVLGALLRRTRLGRALYLIGSNPRAAFIAGLRVRRYLICAYVLCSCVAALGAYLLTARVGSGEPNLGGNLTMTSIAAAVVGGVSLRGGEGRISSPVVGGIFVTVLANGMNLIRVNGSVQQIVMGVVIVIALLADRVRANGGE